MTDDFQMPIDWLVKAKSKGMTDETVAHEFEKFRNHHISKGTTSKDWSRQWATWYLGWVTYGEKQVGSAKAGKCSAEPAWMAGGI